MNHKFKIITLAFALIAFAACQVFGQTVRNVSAEDAAVNPADQQLDIDQEVRFPQVGPKLKSYVTSYMQEVARNLSRDGYNVETMRSGEVVIVVIPTDDIFYPNEEKMLPTASKLIGRFGSFLTPDQRFKVLIAVHSDDTGSEEYNFDLTELRVNAIFDYFESQHRNVDNMIGYPMGASDPLEDNDTRAHRATNRRVEIYIVPSTALLNEARSKKK